MHDTAALLLLLLLLHASLTMTGNPSSLLDVIR